jgi:hypothetical protein
VPRPCVIFADSDRRHAAEMVVEEVDEVSPIESVWFSESGSLADDDVIEFVPILPDDARCEHLDASA